jgi:Spy/CpxP family protein refolding chaperone
MNNKTIALLVAAFCAVGITCAGIAVAALLWTQHFMARKDRPAELAGAVANPPDPNLPDRNPRPNGQRHPGDRGNFQQRGGGGGGNFQGRAGGGMMMLNDDQRQMFQDAQQASNDKLRELEEKFRAAQKETLDAALTAAPDQKAILSKAEAMAAIQVEMIMLRAKALSALVPSLEPDQMQQMTDSPFGVMLLTGGGGGGFPGGPGGGGPGGGGFGGGGRPDGGPDNPGPRPDQ